MRSVLALQLTEIFAEQEKKIAAELGSNYKDYLTIK
jgi:hypothetical protein